MLESGDGSRHWTEAGEIEPGIAEWSRAGKAAEARHAFAEALESYQQALALLTVLPESPERDLRESEIRQSVVHVLHVTKGYAASETKEATERAIALAEKTGNLMQLIGWMTSRWVIAHDSGDLSAEVTLADQLFELGLREGSPTSLGIAHGVQVLTRYLLGDLAGAEKHFTAGLEFFYDPGLRQYPGGIVATFGYASFTAWALGRADLARQRESQMMAYAGQNNPYELAFASGFAAQIRIHTREYEHAETLATQGLELASKYSFTFVAAWNRCVLGRARTELGRATEGVELMRQGIAGLVAVGFGLGIGMQTASLAAALGREGAIADALAAVEKALEANPGQLAYRPEMCRIRGELRLIEGRTELAEADFRDAIALARKMGAKTLELEAATRLARLLNNRGERSAARVILAEIYNWFTEGFDTADLKEAKALLDELGG